MLVCSWRRTRRLMGARSWASIESRFRLGLQHLAPAICPTEPARKYGRISVSWIRSYLSRPRSFGGGGAPVWPILPSGRGPRDLVPTGRSEGAQLTRLTHRVSIRLLLLRPDCPFEVLAVGDPFGNYQVVEAVNSLFSEDRRLWQAVSVGLYEQLPARGPNACVHKALHGEIREFCFGGGMPEPAFRILWFEGNSRKQIVCSYAFLKRPGQGTSVHALEIAQGERERYFLGPDPRITVMKGVL